MGIHVNLAIVAERVSDESWRRIYKMACRVAGQWTPAPLSVAWRHIGSIRVAHYTPDIENEDGLYIVGDAKTFTTAEAFLFPATLGKRRHRPSGSSKSMYDVVVAIARENAPERQRLPYQELFGDKTQGFPYHTLIVALGMLVEHFLPGTAVVHGDMSTEDCEKARQGLATILGEKVTLPVVMDEDRLRRRLAVA